MPDFQQFASECAKESRHWAKAPKLGYVLRTSHEKWLAENFRTAERHARLLQQIWEWANQESQGLGRIGLEPGRAHVRSLLVGQQEDT